MAVEGENDEMDSLFEGMVLFDPNSHQMLDDELNPPPQQLQQSQSLLLHPPSLSSPSDDNTSSSALQSMSASSPRHHQPLDEDLFSDLTLVTPLQNQLSLQIQLEAQPPAVDNTSPTTTPSTNTSNGNGGGGGAGGVAVISPLPSSVSRQIWTRKKKRAGLRVGYGRDVPSDDHDHSTHYRSLVSEDLALSSPLPSSAESVPQPKDESSTSGMTRTEKSDVLHTTCSTSIKDTDSPQSSAADDGNNLLSDGGQTVAVEANPTHTLTRTIVLKSLTTGHHDQVNSLQLKFEQIRAQISEKLGHARGLVASVSAARKDSTRRRRKAYDAVNLMATRHRELEKELEEACEAEDFETAETVSERLATTEKNKECLLIDLRHAEADCDALDYKMQEVLECHIAAEEECASMLENFTVEAAKDAELIIENARVVYERELAGWLLFTEDVELKKIELDIELHLLSAGRLLLSDTIEHSVQDERRAREPLRIRRENLTDELQKLLTLVKGKEAEIAETDDNIEAVEKRIAEVFSSFQEVQSRLDMKYDNLQSGLSQMQQENEALSGKKKETEDFLSEERDRERKLKELAQISSDDAKLYQEAVEHRKSLVHFICRFREDKVRLTETEEKLSEDVCMLRQEISAARVSLQELSSSKSSFQQEIESMKQRLAFFDKRVPELEAGKKVATAARNFKEAARIATETKTLGVEREGLHIKMARAVLELEKLEEEIGLTVNRLQEIEEQISYKEREVAKTRVQRLVLIAGAARAERSAALELGDLEEAGILLAEAEAAESEARKIIPVCGFKEEEFSNLPKHYIAMELVTKLGGKQLAELAASTYIPM